MTDPDAADLLAVDRLILTDFRAVPEACLCGWEHPGAWGGTLVALVLLNRRCPVHGDR